MQYGHAGIETDGGRRDSGGFQPGPVFCVRPQAGADALRLQRGARDLYVCLRDAGRRFPGGALYGKGLRGAGDALAGEIHADYRGLPGLGRDAEASAAA